jgi:predicted membrane protein
MSKDELPLEEFRSKSNNRFWAGIFIIGCGVVLLIRRMGVPIPAWLFSWQMILILVGFFLGVRQRFSSAYWIILMLLGSLFFIRDFVPAIPVRPIIWPVIIIGIGVIYMMNPDQGRHGFFRLNAGIRQGDTWKKYSSEWKSGDQVPNQAEEAYTNISTEDYIDSITILGGVKKNIVSKNFKGGKASSFLGGTEINLSQADLNGTIVLELNQFMGGAKLIVPPNWEIRTELVSIFGGVEDKRPVNHIVSDPNKVMILKGTSIFGGIDIRSY